MKKAIYPGSFNPLHAGHLDVLTKASKVFDKITVCVMQNGEKEGFNKEEVEEKAKISIKLNGLKNVEVISGNGFLHEFVKDYKFDAVIRGLRHTNDLEYEKSCQYWYEDLGLKLPLVYFISDRNLTHISSSTIRSLRGIK